MGIINDACNVYRAKAIPSSWGKTAIATFSISGVNPKMVGCKATTAAGKISYLISKRSLSNWLQVQTKVKTTGVLKYSR